MRRVLALASVLVFICPLFAQIRELRPGFNLFTPKQDIELGKEAAAEVEKKGQVVKNEEITAYLTAIGSRLAKSSRAGAFPFTFTVLKIKP